MYGAWIKEMVSDQSSTTVHFTSGMGNVPSVYPNIVSQRALIFTISFLLLFIQCFSVNSYVLYHLYGHLLLSLLFSEFLALNFYISAIFFSFLYRNPFISFLQTIPLYQNTMEEGYSFSITSEILFNLA